MNNQPVTEFFVEFVGVSPDFRRGFEEGNAKAALIKRQQFSSEAQVLKKLAFLFFDRIEMGQLTETLLRTHTGYLLGLMNGGMFRLKEEQDAATLTTNNGYPTTRTSSLPIKDKKY